MPRPSSGLEFAWRDLGLTVDEFWMKYFSLGGDRPPRDIEAMLRGDWSPDAPDYDFLAQALNEVYVERGGNHPVPYWEDLERLS